MEESEPERDLPVYIHQYPFRFVQPYAFTYRTFTKGRWVGKPLLATLIRQFKAYPPEYYQLAIQAGKITINNKKVEPDCILQNGAQIIHESLRIQPPILDLPIQIIDDSPDFLVINKPPSVIVHTGGGHHFNTVENLLKHEHHYTNLHVLHRLDKNTSGILIFAKNKQKVALFHEESGKEIMKKMYYARVGGDFIWEEKQLSAYIECVSHKDGVYRVTEEIFPKQDRPAHKEEKEEDEKGKQCVGEVKGEDDAVKKQKGNKIKQGNQGKKEKQGRQWNNQLKDSRTLFKKVWYDERTNSSLLQCYPVTGRTHQIRVHLQFMGFPILNDVVYGGRFVGNKIIEFIKQIPEEKNEEKKGEKKGEKKEQIREKDKEKVKECDKEDDMDGDKKGPKEGEEKEDEPIGVPRKKMKLNEQVDASEWDYKTKPWQIMLHSFLYRFGGRQFKTEPPYWFDKQGIDFKDSKH